MKYIKSIISCLIAVAAGMIITCNIETASGPTPYTAPVEYDATSSSKLTMSNGELTLIVEQDLRISPQQKISVSPRNDRVRKMEGLVISYVSKTGELVFNVIKTTGTGTFSSWGILFGNDPWLDSVINQTSLSDSLEKAANILEERQTAYVAMKFGMFLHFSMSTFDRYEHYSVAGEWGLPASAEVTPALFTPSKLDCGQWADVAKSAGCKYMVLTSKHHDGFCIWDSKYTKHDVGLSPWPGTEKRDVLREFVDSARAEGLKVGFYYSIWDKTHGASASFVKGQLTELLTNYGPIECLWFDGWKWQVGYNALPYDTIRHLIKRLQPACLLIENNHYYKLRKTDIVEFEMPIDGPPQEGNTMPTEACQSIRTDQLWFWHPEKEGNMMPAQKIADELAMVNSRNATYLLDLTPDTTGLIPQCAADRMAEVGQLLGVEP